MVGLQRMSSGLMDSCRSPLSSTSLGETPSLFSDSLSTISESDDSGFRSAQTPSIDLKTILGVSKDVDGVADQKIGEIGSQGESKKEESITSCLGKLSLSHEDKNEDAGPSDDCAAVRKSSLECSDKLESSDVTTSLEVERSEVSGESGFSVETISSEAENSESSDKPESELSGGTKLSEGEKSEVYKDDVSCGISDVQGGEEMPTISLPKFEGAPPSAPVSCCMHENVKDNTNDKSLKKYSDQKNGIGTKTSYSSNIGRKSTDQPLDLTKKRELFARKANDLPAVTRNSESPVKKSLDQQTVSRSSEKSKATRTSSDQPTQSLPSSRNTASAVTQGKPSTKPGDLKSPPKTSEPATRKSPASSFVPITKASDSLVSARKFAVQQSTQKTTKPKKAPTFVRKMKNLQVLEGSAAKFEVLIDGNPTPAISWFKDGKEIPLALEKYRTESSDDGRCSLTVASCGEDDDAEYGCKASNSLGSIETKANLYVEPIGEELENNNSVRRNRVK